MKKTLCKIFLKVMGWEFVGEVPEDVKKAVLVCAPHTSNWDFPLALASFVMADLKVNYFIKKSWFFFPMNFLFKATGGIPIDRSKNHGLVDSMSLLLKESDELIVAVPAEGTRSWVPKWKTGFYHIAKSAKVPIIMGFVDFKIKEVGFGPVLNISGDFVKDMSKIQAFFENKSGKYSNKYNPNIF